MSGSASKVEWRGVFKRYGSVEAVKDLTLSVPGGAITCLVGPNGAGKTTALELAAGMRFPDVGEVLVDGVSSASSRFVAARRQLGFMAEEPTLYPALTPREFLRFIAEMRGMAPGAEATIDALMTRFALRESADRLCADLSMGQRRKTAFIASILGDPSTLLLDEPTNGMDPAAAREVKDYLRECREAGRAVLFSTHVMELAEHLADRVAILREGSLVFVGSLGDLRATARPGEERTLEASFLRLTAPSGRVDRGLRP